MLSVGKGVRGSMRSPYSFLDSLSDSEVIFWQLFSGEGWKVGKARRGVQKGVIALRRNVIL
jgi:hypothetical protein